MEFTKTQQKEIAGGALANRVKDRGHTGRRLDVAFEEVAQQIMDENRDKEHKTIAAIVLEDIWENDLSGRRWNDVCRFAKRSLTGMGRAI